MIQNNIIKIAMALAILLMPSITMADKIEIQDSTVIIVGKGKTNKKGMFTPTCTNSIDSLLIDEIVLTYTERAKKDFVVKDSISNETIFSHEVTNSMTKNEMKDLYFSLLSGHTYFIKHGTKEWKISLPVSQEIVKQTKQSDSTMVNSDVEEDRQVPDGKASSISWLLWLLVGVVLGATCVYLFIKYLAPKMHTENSEENSTINEGSTLPEYVEDDSEISNDKKKLYTENISDKPKVDPKEQAHKKTLQRIAKLLGLQEYQLQYNFFETKINELLENSAPQKEPPSVDDSKSGPTLLESFDIYKAQDLFAQELIKKFEQRTIYAEIIEQAKANVSYYDRVPKEYDIIKGIIDEIAKTLRTLKGQLEKTRETEEPVKETIVSSSFESYTEWLGKRLKELFDFAYDGNMSVKQNLERLIIQERNEPSPSELEKEAAPIPIEVEQIRSQLTNKNQEIEGLNSQLKEKNDKINELEGQLNTKGTEIEGLKGQIGTKNSKINELNSKITEQEGVIRVKTSEISTLKESYEKEQQANMNSLVAKLYNLTDAIEWRTMFDPCDNDDATMNQCYDIEKRLKEKLVQMKERLCGFVPVKSFSLEQIRKAIQEILVKEITSDESVVNSLCRLYAYSNLSFMTDAKREYGVRLRRKNIHDIFYSLENLYIQFGIKLQVPPLFVMESKDGDYENVTGQAYSELGNLCPNVNNHCDNIDSTTKLKDVIVDIDRVGYAVDGNLEVNARVLTY